MRRLPLHFVVLFFCAVVGVSVGAIAPASARVGVTSVTSGEPLGRPPAEPERVLRVGVDVQFNERVTTRSDDRAHFVFLDGSSLSVGPNSDLTIDKFVFDPDKNTGELAISTTRGTLRFVGGAISKKTDVEVKTPSATIGIRGGIVTVSVSNTGATNATFLYGQRMTVRGQSLTQVATRNGSQINVPPGGRPGPPVIIPPRGFSGAAFERGQPPRGPAQPPQQGATQPQFQPQPQPQTTTQQQPTQRTQTQQTQTTQTQTTEPRPTHLAIAGQLGTSQLHEMNSGPPGAPPRPGFGPGGQKGQGGQGGQGGMKGGQRFAAGPPQGPPRIPQNPMRHVPKPPPQPASRR